MRLVGYSPTGGGGDGGSGQVSQHLDYGNPYRLLRCQTDFFFRIEAGNIIKQIFIKCPPCNRHWGEAVNKRVGKSPGSMQTYPTLSVKS